MVTMLVLMITLGGILGFRYFSVRNAEYAEDQLLAARAAQVLTDAWRGKMGDTDFDPTQQGFDSDFQVESFDLAEATNVSTFDSGTQLGTYRINTEGRTFRAVLSYEDDWAIPNARLLHVVLVWQGPRQSREQFQLSTLTRTNI